MLPRWQTLVDFTREGCAFRMYKWKLGQPESDLDRLAPFHRFVIERR
jgi:hypothetical protein